MAKGLHIDRDTRKGEMKKDDQVIGRFNANDSYLTRQELLDIRKAIDEDRDEVIRAAKEKRLGLNSMVFRDFKNASDQHVKSAGKTMTDIQERLEKATGMDTGAQGYGPKMFEAAIKYQEDNGINVDGIIGPETLAALYGEKTTRQSTRSAPVSTSASSSSTENSTNSPTSRATESTTTSSTEAEQVSYRTETTTSYTQIPTSRIPSAETTRTSVSESSGSYTTTIRLSDDQLNKIGQSIWDYECDGTVSGLTTWNKGESFPSLGIGHFIWYPAGKSGPFEESLPQVIAFIEKNGGTIPDILKKTDAPWQTNEQFTADKKGREEIQKFFMQPKIRQLQAQYIIDQRLGEYMNKIPTDKQALVKQRFEQVGSTTEGVRSLADYINFKGDGTVESERYKGQGWGLTQVLEGMKGNPTGIQAAKEFGNSAARILSQRIANAPASRGEGRWKGGWMTRVGGYGHKFTDAGSSKLNISQSTNKKETVTPVADIDANRYVTQWLSKENPDQQITTPRSAILVYNDIAQRMRYIKDTTNKARLTALIPSLVTIAPDIQDYIKTSTEKVATYTPAPTSSEPQYVGPARSADTQDERPTYVTPVRTLSSGLQVTDASHPLLLNTDIINMMSTYEGWSSKPKKDGPGYDLGYGINTGSGRKELMYVLGANFSKWMSDGIPKNEGRNVIRRMLQSRIVQAKESCEKRDINFDELPSFAQVVITDMHYNMTPSGIDSFKLFWTAVKEEDWKEAALQLVDHGDGGPSDYLGDTYVRAYANARILLEQNADGYAEYRDEGSKLIKGQKSKNNRTTKLLADMHTRIQNAPDTPKRSETMIAGSRESSERSPEAREQTVTKEISLTQAYDLVGRSNPPTKDDSGRYIVYKIKLKESEKGRRYLSNTDPRHQKGIDVRNLGPNGKEGIVVHKTAAGWDEGGNVTDAEANKRGLKRMIETGFFPYLVTRSGLIIQGADDMTTGGAINTHLANTNMKKKGGYDNFNNRFISVEFVAKGFKHNSGKYDQYETIAKDQQAAGRALIESLQTKHNISSQQVITSADPIRSGTDSFMASVTVNGVRHDPHGDDFTNWEAQALGIASQSERLALLHSGGFFDVTPTQTPSRSIDRSIREPLLEIASNVDGNLSSTARSTFENQLEGKGQLRVISDPNNGGREVVAYVPEGFKKGDEVVFHLHGLGGDRFGGSQGGASADKWLSDALVAARANGSMLVYPISDGTRGTKGYDTKWFKKNDENPEAIINTALANSGLNRSEVNITAQGHSAGGLNLPEVISSVGIDKVVMLDATYGDWGSDVISAVKRSNSDARIYIIKGSHTQTHKAADKLKGKPGVTVIDGSDVRHTDMNKMFFAGGPDVLSRQLAPEHKEDLEEMSIDDILTRLQLITLLDEVLPGGLASPLATGNKDLRDLLRDGREIEAWSQLSLMLKNTDGDNEFNKFVSENFGQTKLDQLRKLIGISDQGTPIGRGADPEFRRFVLQQVLYIHDGDGTGSRPKTAPSPQQEALLAQIRGKLGSSGKKRYDSFYNLSSDYKQKFRGCDVRFGLEGSGIQNLNSSSGRFLIVDNARDQAAVYEKSGGRLVKVKEFPMIGGRKTDTNFDKAKEGDKTSPLGVYSLTRKHSGIYGRKTFTMDVPTHIGTALDIHPPGYRGLSYTGENSAVRSGKDLSSGCFTPTHEDFNWLSSTGMPNGGTIISVPTTYGDFPDEIGNGSSMTPAFNYAQKALGIKFPEALASYTKEGAQQYSEQVKTALSGLSPDEKDALYTIIESNVITDERERALLVQSYAHLDGKNVTIDGFVGDQTRQLIAEYVPSEKISGESLYALSDTSEMRRRAEQKYGVQLDALSSTELKNFIYAREKLFDSGLAKLFSSDGGHNEIGHVDHKKRTYLGRLKQKTVDGMASLIVQLRKDSGNPNLQPVLNGASELGHATYAYSHGNGYKFDLRINGNSDWKALKAWSGHSMAYNFEKKYKTIGSNKYAILYHDNHFDIQIT